MKSMALYGERKVFYATKTTCFAVVETLAYRSKDACLSLKGRLLIAQGLRAYRSWAVCLLLVTSLLIT